MQLLMKIPFIRNRRYYREAGQFVAEQQEKGILLEDKLTPEKLYEVSTLVVDAPLLLQGRRVVQRLAAPLTVCTPERFKHQKAWMVLTAGISLGCAGYAPLERFARELSFAPERMLRQYPLLEEIPYDDERQIETTLHRDGAGYRAYAKGDPEAILGCCTRVLDGGERLIEAEDRVHVLRAAGVMEADGMHTLAFATRWLSAPDDYEADMTFLGIVGMGILPQEDAYWTMGALRESSIRPVLVSEREIMAGAARGAGVLRPTGGAMDADEMDRLTDERLAEAVKDVDVYTGVDAMRRMRILRAFETDGTVAYLSRMPEGDGLRLTLGSSSKAPEIIISEGGLSAVVRLFGECRSLCESFRNGKVAEVAEGVEAETPAQLDAQPEPLPETVAVEAALAGEEPVEAGANEEGRVAVVAVDTMKPEAAERGTAAQDMEAADASGTAPDAGTPGKSHGESVGGKVASAANGSEPAEEANHGGLAE